MSAFGVANPAGAAALAAVVVLVALHLFERRRRVVPVATLFLWRRLPAASREPERFRTDRLFWLRLALLLALAGGYLRPWVETATAPGTAPALVIVLDVSASMQTREPEGTRFELARRRAGALVGAGTTVMLVTAADRPHVVLGWTADAALVRRRLETLEPLDLPTSLAPAVGLALAEARVRAGARVAVVTDLAPEASTVSARALAEVHWIQVGRSDDNVAVASLVVDAPALGSDGARATAVVRNYGHAPRRVRVEASIEGRRWARREVLLPARASVPVALADPPGSGVLRVTLARGDALAADDTAWAWIPPREPLDVLFVTEAPERAAAFESLAVAIAPGRIEVAGGAGYASPGPALGRRVVVFDRLVPATEPAAAALYVSPPAGNTLCPIADAAGRARAVDWEAEHPALAGLRSLEALEVGAAQRLVAPDWAAPLVVAAPSAGAGAFPLLVAGERDGRRVACLGARFAGPHATSDRLPLALLVLSTLRWLAEPAAALAVETGVPVPLDGPAPAEVPAGLRVAGEPPVLVAERAGSHRLGARIVLASLRDDRESDVGRSGGGKWPASTRPPPAARARDVRQLGWWLYAAAAGLFAVEWVVWLRRRA